MTTTESPVSTSVVYCFLKLVDEKDHAESLLTGNLRFGKLRYFKEFTDKNGEMRGDPLEGIVSWLQPNKIQLKLGEARVSSADITRPIPIHDNNLLNRYAFCLYAMNSGDADSVTAALLPEFLEILKLHKKSFGLGKFCVVIKNAREFQRRVSTALDGKVDGGMAQVNYFKESGHYARLPQQYDGMHKRDRFSHQNEYRILTDFDSTENTFTFNVGDLSDIAFITTPEEFNKGLKVSLSEKETKGCA